MEISASFPEPWPLTLERKEKVRQNTEA